MNISAALMLCTSTTVFAQSASAGSNSWQYEATPYLWAAGVSGTTRVGSRLPEVNVDASFSDITKNLSGGLMGALEARKDRWGVLFDLIYIKLSKDSRPLLGGRLGIASADFTESIFQLAGAYRVSDSITTPVDVLAGVRYTNLDADLSLSSSPLLPSGASRSGSVNWTDGFVGVRIGQQLTDRWALVGYADIGGGGTKKSWQYIVGANYCYSDKMTGKFGYRALSMDYDKPEFLYNMKTAGVYAGLGIKF
ncbi:MAG: hypothetical protein ACXVAO_12600 [Vulcanimicrobiaceae bacterium]